MGKSSSWLVDLKRYVQKLVKFLPKGPSIYHVYPASGGTQVGRQLAKLGETRFYCCKAKASTGEVPSHREQADVSRLLLQWEDGLYLPFQVEPATRACLHTGHFWPEDLAVFSLVTEILYMISLRLQVPMQGLHCSERGEAPTTQQDMQRGCPEQKGRLSLSASLHGSD